MVTTHLEPLFQALDDGALLLTVNRRLAGHLRRAYDDRQQAAGLAVWATPEILPYGAWLNRCWSEGREALHDTGTGTAGSDARAKSHATLLSPPQAEVLWERVIAESPEAARILHPLGTARLAAEAWEILQRWRLEPPRDDGALSAESGAFARWSARFVEICLESGWTDPSRMPETVSAWFRDGVLPPPPRIVHTGFDEIVPQQAALFDLLAGMGTDVSQHTLPDTRGESFRTGLPDEDAEIEAAARWARHILEQGRLEHSRPDRDDTAETIAIVVPDLNARRERIERIFADVLAPAALAGSAHTARPFNISLGLPLADVPIVRDALDLLQPLGRKVPLASIGRLLRSPYLVGAEDELTRRALLYRDIRGWGAPELVWRSVREAAGRRSSDGRPARCPVLAKGLAQREAVEGEAPSSQSPGAWAGTFAGMLRALGWPGQRSTDSAEFQAIEAWKDLLTELASLEVVLPRASHAEALTRLRRLAASRVFQPESEPAPVQILGLLESGGLSFGHIWLLGFHDGIWPATPRPNPFLSYPLQRAHDLPRATPGWELRVAHAHTERLLRAAPDVVASHALNRGEEELRISPLLAHLPERAPEEIPTSGVAGLLETVRESGTLETLVDIQAPPITETIRWPGGVGLYRDQSACPFRAFAIHRLHARPLDHPEAGLPASQKGSIVHKALEFLWGNLESHDRLCRTGDDSLREIVTDATRRALQEARAKSSHLGGSRLLEIEERRVIGLLTLWLDKERARRPFTVEKHETQQVVSFGGVEVNTRIDRIDRLDSGGHVVIDYKTGRTNTNSWFGKRPDEPQLPLYCSSAGLDLAGVAFARVSRDGMGYQGIALEKDILPGGKTFDGLQDRETGADYSSPEALVGGWTGVLDALGNSFRTGDARVDPKNPQITCRYCPLPALCRIHELDGPASPAEETEGD